MISNKYVNIQRSVNDAVDFFDIENTLPNIQPNLDTDI